MKVKDLIDKLKPLPADILNCLKEMEILKTNFTNCRAYFPSMTEENIGTTNLITAPFYVRQGFNITFQFSSARSVYRPAPTTAEGAIEPND